ncbi:MAG TPA: type II secretion system F family protein [Acidimicrobiia bacterium]
MLTAVTLASGLAAGVPIALLAAMLLAANEPRLGAAMAIVLVIAGRRQTAVPPAVAEGTYLQAISAELRTGSSLRVALAQAVHRVPELPLIRLARLAAAGRPVPELQRELRSALPHTGIPVASALAVLDETGGRAASVFEGLALQAYEEASLHRETRVASAQTRLSGLIVGGLPVGFIAFTVVRGRMGSLIETAPALLVAGGLMLVLGAGAMLLMLRNASRGAAGLRQGVDLLATLVFVGLTAGLSLRGALERAAPSLPPRLEREVRGVLRATPQSGLAPTLASAEGEAAPFFSVLARASVTGAPIAGAVDAFLTQARESQKTSALERARKLPVRLMIPLALLILPAFVLLVIGPALASSITRVLGPYLP